MDVGRGFCVSTSTEKARRSAPLGDGVCVGLGRGGERYMPKLSQERVLIVIAAA